MVGLITCVKLTTCVTGAVERGPAVGAPVVVVAGSLPPVLPPEIRSQEARESARIARIKSSAIREAALR
jgi:hypothetical protein